MQRGVYATRVDVDYCMAECTVNEHPEWDTKLHIIFMCKYVCLVVCGKRVVKYVDNLHKQFKGNITSLNGLGKFNSNAVR